MIPRPLVYTTRAVTPEQAQSAAEASVRIARTVRRTLVAVGNIQEQRVTMVHFLAFAADRAAALGEWLASVRDLPEAFRAARRDLRELVELLGRDGSVLDHGWDHGTGPIALVDIEQHLAGAEAVAAPLTALLVDKPRRAAA